MNDKITTKDKRQITKDWLSFFPSFREYKPMWIIRRNDVFLCGIHLQRHSGNVDYEPIFHIYNLMVDFPVISFGAASYLLNQKGARDSVTLSQHKENFKSYTERLQQQVSLLQKDTISCDELVSYIKIASNNSFGCPAESLRNIVLTLFWFGRTAEAEQEVENSKKIISQWDNASTERFWGVQGWEKQVRGLMNIDTLNSTIEYQLKKYKLENFQDFQLIK